MSRTIDPVQLAKHATVESCWVALFGYVYDVTQFLKEHPGGPNVIIKLAGKDATAAYSLIHPPELLEEHLKPMATLGSLELFDVPESERTANVSESHPSMASLFNIKEIEEAATKRISKKAWTYYYSASDDQFSKSYNNGVYQKILLRPRIFVDCTSCDTSTSFFGHHVEIPLFVSPAARARYAHPDGEQGIAKAVSRFGAMQIISYNASMTPEQIIDGAPEGQVFGWQLYIKKDRIKSERMLARINRLSDKIKFICLTLDTPVPGKRDMDEKFKYIELSTINSAGTMRKVDSWSSSPEITSSDDARDLTWESTLNWLSKHTSLPIVLKGIQTHEDVYLATQYTPQVKGILLSNHGGRALDTAPPALHTLLEIRRHCPEALSKVDVWVDGGIKRGTDIVKALCLGAKMVGIGRAALFGLGAGGQEGVERVFEILRREMEICMRLLGVQKVDELGSRHVNTRMLERDIFKANATELDKEELWPKAKL